MKTDFNMADLFCGAGGTTEGAEVALRRMGYKPRVTAVNHWHIAVQTHRQNHPDSRTLCASLDSLNPRDMFENNQLDGLWASPECTHHSRARGGKPINEQSRATAYCVVRWADALLPPHIWVENVPEFAEWGPLGANLKPLKSRRGEVFSSWLRSIEALGYRVEHRILCAADYGDPTTRRRLIVQAVRGRRKIVWPNATHARPCATGDLFGNRKPWVAAREIIDWTLPGIDIRKRKSLGLRPLAPRTLDRIEAGLRKYGGEAFIVVLRGTNADQTNSWAQSIDSPLPTVSAGGIHAALCEPFIIPMEHGGKQSLRGVGEPLPTITTARGGSFGLCEPFLVHTAHRGGNRVRGINQPLPTVTGNRGDMALVQPFITKFYGTGSCASIDDPLDTVTAKDRFGLVQQVGMELRFRMLKPHELAGAQGFPSGYRFAGNVTEQVRQIGNAVPCHMAAAIVAASVAQDADAWRRIQAA